MTVPDRDVVTIAEHLAVHGRGGRRSQALWALTEKQDQFKLIRDDSGDPYLLRIYLTRHDPHVLGAPVNERVLPALYLHYFFRGDTDRELHNHPWQWAVSWILTGGYIEERYSGPIDAIRPERVTERTVRPGAINVIRHDTYHRVRMLDGTGWSLFMAGPRVAATRGEDWGFVDTRAGTYESWGQRDARRLQEARNRGR